MKKLELETSKGEFVLVDETDLPKIDKLLIAKDSNFIKLSDITEEQAQQVVRYVDGWGFINYSLRTQIKEGLLKTAIESLDSLLKSKGVHLYQNPYENSTDLNSSFFSMQEDFNKEKEAEEKTFYNPYLFKVI